MRFEGLPYPIVRHPRGLLRTQTGINQIKSDLLVLLLTNPGERVMLPEFGTPLNQLLFEPNDSILKEQVRQAIIDTINRFEPRVTIDGIEITTSFSSSDLNLDDTRDEQGNILGIKIRFFDPENIQEVQELSLEVPLAGG